MRKLHYMIIIFCAILAPMMVNAQLPAQGKRIRLNLQAAMGGTASSYLSGVHFTVFDTDPAAAFGNIDQLEVTDSSYIILDRDTKSVLVFDKQGKFRARIDGRKIYPQRPNLYSFLYEAESKTIKLNFKTEIFTFNLDGVQLGRQKKSFQTYLGTEQYLSNGFIGHYMYSPQIIYKKKDTLGYQLMVSHNGIVTDKYLPYKTGITLDDSNGSQSTMDFTKDSSNSDTLNFTREYDYNIYRLGKNKLSIAYNFILPMNASLPKDFRTDTAYDGKRIKFISANKTVIYKISRFYKSGESLFFKTVASDFSNLSYRYDLKSANLVCLNKIVSDASTFFLPITDSELGGYDFNNRGILAKDEDSFYTSYSSLVLFRQMEASKSKKIKYPENLKKYFSKKANQKGNPVLVEFKFKPAN